MTSSHKRMQREKLLARTELEEGFSELFGLNPADDKDDYNYDEYDDFDLEYGQFDYYDDPYEDDYYDDYYEQYEDAYDWYDDYYDWTSPFKCGDQVESANGDKFIVTEDERFVNLLTGKYSIYDWTMRKIF